MNVSGTSFTRAVISLVAVVTALLHSGIYDPAMSQMGSGWWATLLSHVSILVDSIIFVVGVSLFLFRIRGILYNMLIGVACMQLLTALVAMAMMGSVKHSVAVDAILSLILIVTGIFSLRVDMHCVRNVRINIVLTSIIILHFCIALIMDNRSGTYSAAMDADQVKQELFEGNEFLFIDARSHNVFSRESIDGAISIPYGPNSKELVSNIEEVEKADYVLVYGDSKVCYLARSLANDIGSMYGKTVYYLNGGIESWNP